MYPVIHEITHEVHRLSSPLSQSSRWVGGFLIESGIPVPEKNGRARTGISAAIRALAVGESLLVKDKKASALHAYAARVGIRIRTKQEEDESGAVRIWRIE